MSEISFGSVVILTGDDAENYICTKRRLDRLRIQFKLTELKLRKLILELRKINRNK